MKKITIGLFALAVAFGVFVAPSKSDATPYVPLSSVKQAAKSTWNQRFPTHVVAGEWVTCDFTVWRIGKVIHCWVFDRSSNQIGHIDITPANGALGTYRYAAYPY